MLGWLFLCVSIKSDCQNRPLSDADLSLANNKGCTRASSRFVPALIPKIKVAGSFLMCSICLIWLVDSDLSKLCDHNCLRPQAKKFALRATIIGLCGFLQIYCRVV